MKNNIIFILVACVIYLLCKHVIPFGYLVLYPIKLFVTYLHESGHALFAVLTGGKVSGIQINANGSGYALVAGGVMPIVLAGGYIGSALFGNIILYIALVRRSWNTFLAMFFLVVMLLTGIFLYQSITTSIILFVFATVLYILIRYFEDWLPRVHAIIGSASILYILEDFWGGPSSDLAHFGMYFPFIPTIVWAFVWLAIAAYITYCNIRYFILRSSR